MSIMVSMPMRIIIINYILTTTKNMEIIMILKMASTYTITLTIWIIRVIMAMMGTMDIIMALIPSIWIIRVIMGIMRTMDIIMARIPSIWIIMDMMGTMSIIILILKVRLVEDLSLFQKAILV